MSEQVIPDWALKFTDGSVYKPVAGDRPPRGYGCQVDGCHCQTAECNQCGLRAPDHEPFCPNAVAYGAEKPLADWEKALADTRKPMRIRVLTLPAEIHANQPPSKPFIIIVDRAAIDPETITPLALAIKTQTGARGVLVFDEEVEIGD